MADGYPELDKERWQSAHQLGGMQGGAAVTRAMELMTTGVANAGNKVSGQVMHLTQRLEQLNERLDKFNTSSELLTRKAINLTFWIMIATCISGAATAILAIDVVLRWFKLT